MKYTFAVLALIYGVEAIRFAGDTEDEDEMTRQSIKEAEKQFGTKLPEIGKAGIADALAENNKINFNGETLTKVSVRPFEIHRAYPGVTFLQTSSDPIYGGLGAPVVPMSDLTPEQQFEEGLRRTPKPVFKDESDPNGAGSTKETRESIESAEAITGGRMPDPRDKVEIKRIERGPEYHLHTSEEEDPETRETRRSVKTIEKREKHRFWINAREKKDFDAAVAAGKVNPAQLTFSEGKDEDIGEADMADAKQAKENAKADAKKAAKAEEDAKKTPKQLEEEKKAAEDAEADADAKAESPEAAEGKKKEEKKVEAAKKEEAAAKEGEAAPAGDLPPELAGAAIQIKLEQYGVRPDYSSMLY